MNNVSPTTHVFRLFAVLGVALAVFLVWRAWAVPESWNYHVWYRAENLSEERKLPRAYGGNESCKSCHEDISLTERVQAAGGFGDSFEDEFMDVPATEPDEAAPQEFEHKGLSCESCHGPLADHADENDKIADALVMNKSNWQCLNCHALLISRPSDVAPFTEDIEEHRDMRENTL
ncbi:MAG: hypothetical protein HUJ31_00555, partial [Pseudomonadales bacterium]|nr:hypothetical protein [Pseudomonadales bacterium]